MTSRITLRSLWRIFVGLWEIAFGILAIGSWIELAIHMRRDSVGLVLIVIGGVLFSVLSLASGVGLLRGKTSAVLPSACVQALQIVGVSSGSIVYQLTLGPFLNLMIIWGYRVSLFLGYQPRLSLAVNTRAVAPTGLAINLVACLLLLAVLASDPSRGSRPSDRR